MTSVPPYVDPFAGVALKLARAEEHLDTLYASLQRILEPKPYPAVRIQTSPDGMNWAAVVALPDEDHPDPLWSVLVGEILYQVRSSLDHIVNALVPKITKDTLYPIRVEESSFDNDTGRQLEGIGEPYRAVIKKLQPFRTYPENPRMSVPWALNELANIDRHRFIHTSGLWLTEQSYVIFDPPGFGTIEQTVQLPIAMEYGTTLATGKILRTAEQPEVHVNFVGIPDIVITSLAAYRGLTKDLNLRVSGLRDAINYAHIVRRDLTVVHIVANAFGIDKAMPME
jgi:hypothetical protein